MDKSSLGEKKQSKFTAEEIDGLERTLEYVPAPGIEHVRAKEEEIKKGVKDSWEGIIGEPVDVVSIKYLGDGRFECDIVFGEKAKRQRRSVTIQEPKKKFE